MYKCILQNKINEHDNLNKYLIVIFDYIKNILLDVSSHYYNILIKEFLSHI